MTDVSWEDAQRQISLHLGKVEYRPTVLICDILRKSNIELQVPNSTSRTTTGMIWMDVDGSSCGFLRWPKDGLDAIFLALGVAQPVRYADETAPSAEEAAPAGAAAENGQTQR